MLQSNKFPVSFRFGALLNALNQRCADLKVSRNFYVFVLIKSHLSGVTLSDEEIVELWVNRTGRLDDIAF